jgi:hypothetical protein
MAWFQRLIASFVGDVPPAIACCFDCHKPLCANYAMCPGRLARLAQEEGGAAAHSPRPIRPSRKQGATDESVKVNRNSDAGQR